MTDKAFDKYKNIIILRDINIDIKRDRRGKSELFSHFCKTFSFQNLIKSDTCFTKTSVSSVDIILTNQLRFHAQPKHSNRNKSCPHIDRHSYKSKYKEA